MMEKCRHTQRKKLKSPIILSLRNNHLNTSLNFSPILFLSIHAHSKTVYRIGLHYVDVFISFFLHVFIHWIRIVLGSLFLRMRARK